MRVVGSMGRRRGRRTRSDEGGDRSEESDLDLFGTNAPFWQRHYGIGHPWHATDRGRRGCIVMLAVALAIMVVVVVIALVWGTG